VPERAAPEVQGSGPGDAKTGEASGALSQVGPGESADLEPLAPGLLYHPCDPALLDFETTEQLEDLTDSFGQARGYEAIRLGVEVTRPGYNLFVLGTPGSGRHTAVRQQLEGRASAEPPPRDWCYVHNFAEPTRPRALPVPAGRGAQLRHDMTRFSDDLGKVIATIFEGEEYRVRIEAIQQEYKEKEGKALGELGEESAREQVAFLGGPHGFGFAPMKDGEAMDAEAFQKLPEEEQQRFAKLIEKYGERLHKLVHQFPRSRREMQERIRQVSRDAMALAVGHLIEELKDRYTDLPEVLAFLDEVLRDVIETGEELRAQQKSEGEMAAILMGGKLALQRYQVNLLVDHRSAKAAPVVYEDHPTYASLVGRIDHETRLGMMITNFTLIRPGALHQANGGYLVLDALKVLAQPFAWEALKRALKAGQIRIESSGQLLGVNGALPLEPEPVPLSIKLALIGEPFVYYLLRSLDPEFEELFKVAAEFESDMDRNSENTRLYARLVATLVRKSGLKPFERGAVARIVEQGARQAEDAEKLSACVRWISDLLCEADYQATRGGRGTVGREQVDEAIRQQVRRADRLRDRIQEAVLRDTLLIATGGELVGQINGLSLVDLGDFRFAYPIRITATARVGEGDVIDIEREAELGGAIHSKGVLILSSFLASRYSHSLPLSLAASLVFEQSYGVVEGDSASLAELCALLSALAEVGIRQTLAVTGSVDQYGRVQAIGGVNEKIEGFFDICDRRGLSGDQGVLIPQANVKHLMLREDVVRACFEGKFHVYAVNDVDQAIGMLTGLPAGRPDENGIIPAGTVNYLVARALAEMSDMRREFGTTGSRGRKRGKKG